MSNESYFDTIMVGLEESLKYSKGELTTVKKHKVTIAPIPSYEASKIKQIRKSLNLTQMIFAEVLGVSTKTVEAWESGRNKPQGPASRFLQMIEMDKDLFKNHNILSL